jgi:BON domain
MAYDDKRRSRVVVQTPTSRREVSQTEPVVVMDRGGVSATTVGIIVVIAVAVITVLALLLLNGQTLENSNNNVAQQPAPAPQSNTAQPAQQPPVIVQQPAPVTQPAPIIVTPPTASGGNTQSGPDDAAIQAAIDKRIADDPTYSTLGITATVLNGKVTLVGEVKSEAMKVQLEKMVKGVKGVKSVDNQITVNAGQ